MSFVLAMLLAASPVSGPATIRGTVTDVATGKPLRNVAVTLSAPSFDDVVVHTDETGSFEATGLSRGVSRSIWTVRFETEGYRPYSRGGIDIAYGTSVRLSVMLLPEAFTETEIEVMCRLDPVDEGSNQTGVTITSEELRLLPLLGP